MRIALGVDHAGFPLKPDLLAILASLSAEVRDYGAYDPAPVDFPDIARAVCTAVRAGEAERAILLCGTGVGAAIAANKLPGMRAAVCHDVYSAHQAVEHDDVNVLCLGAKIIGPWLMADIVQAFLRARFADSEDVRRRVGKLSELELDAARELQSRL